MFEITHRVEDAAQRVAAGDLSLEAIAREVGVSSRALRNWRHKEAFGTRVEEIRAQSRRNAHGKTRQGRTVAYLVVVDGRGGRGEGDDAAELVPLYAVDADLLGKLRDLEERPSREPGQSAMACELASEDAALLEAAIAKVYDEPSADGKDQASRGSAVPGHTDGATFHDAEANSPRGMQ
jgi:hypothetical protein